MIDFLHTLPPAILSTVFDVAPIVAVLTLFQIFVLRRRLPNLRRTLAGLVCVLLGLALFLVGLENALFPIGEAMAFQLTAHAAVGAQSSAGVVDWRDYLMVYIFGAAIGFATTVAEPSLIAVAIKAEEVSGGTVQAWGLRIAVAVGVAIGVSLGCFRIVTGTPLPWYIIAAYAIVIVQTYRSSRTIIPLAYDSGGVTTSTVTVPVVAALGLGLAASIPGRNPLIDGFGLIAFASVFPIMTVPGLLYGGILVEPEENRRWPRGGRAMRLKLIVALVSDDKTDVVVDAARTGGATGATIITSVRGEGLRPGRTFFGLSLEGKRDMVLFLVLETRARDILERIHEAARFDAEHGAGIAFQLDIEDAVGLGTQLPAILEELEYDL